MKFPHIKLLFLPVLFAVSAVYAEQLDSLKAELNKIETLDNSTPGVLITGEFRSGALGSILDDNGTVNTGVNAATDADIKLQARPTAETRVTALFRVHQDWQKSHEEGISPVLLNWLSYDGKAWGGKIDFNLGDMRIAYSPLTIYAPLLAIENEAEIFALRRKDAMAYNNLQNDGGRLLQGLNFAMHSGKVLILDDLYLQGTLSRLRAQPRKWDAVFFDYDDTDRILLAGRGGLSLYGISLGANYAYTFTREEPLKNLHNSVETDSDLRPGASGVNPVPFLIENVSVMSGTIGLDVARLAGLNGWKIDAGAEYAMSNYETANFYSDKKDINDIKVVDESWVEIDGELRSIDVVRYAAAYSDPSVKQFKREPLDELKGSALLASLEVSSPSSLANANFKASFIKNDKDFVSELAQNPVYYTPANVLNAGSVDKLRMATTLENLYFATYTNDPLTRYNLIVSKSNNYPYNNYKKVHSLRSGYSNLLKSPSELRAIELDPGVNLSLPFGLATPDRQGVLLKAECSLLDDKLGLNVFANKIDQKEEVEASYLDAGGGLVAEVGKFIGLSQVIRINGGYGMSAETDGYERSVNRASAGLRIGVAPKISILGGMELVKKDYGKLFMDEEGGAIGTTGDELLWLAGPEFELSRGSYFNLQYGMLNYKYETSGNLIEFNRNLISADVRIKF